MNRNWWVGMANRGRVSSRMPSTSKSSRFWDARISADSFFRTRFRVLRMYSMVVMLDSQIYSSSRVATVLPTVRSLSLRKDMP